MKAQVIQNGFGRRAKKAEGGNNYEYKAELVEETNYPHPGTHTKVKAKVYLNEELGWISAQIYDANKNGDVEVRLSVCEHTEKGKIEAVLLPNEVSDEIVEFFNKEQEIRENKKAQQDEYRRSQMYNY